MIRKLHRKYFSNDFSKNVFTLTSGSFLAQLIFLLITPILTHLFSSDVFGVFFIYTSIFGILTILSTLRFEMAILLPDNDVDAANLLAISIISSFTISLMSLFLIIFLKTQIVAFLRIEEIQNWLYFIPLSVFLIGCFQSLTFWSNRMKKYSWIAIAKINRSSVSSLSQVLTGITSLQSVGLIPGLILGQITSVIDLLIRNVVQYKYIISNISLAGIRTVVKKYKDIPLFSTMIAMVNTLSNQLPFYLLPRYFGASIVGYYGLSNKVIRTPVTLIAESIGQVSYRKASELLNAGKSIYALIKNNYINAIKISIIPYLLLFLFAPFLFRIFGNEWVIAGEYTQILTPFLFISFLNSTNSFIITLLNKQKVIIYYDILLLMARFAALYIGFHIFNEAKMAIILYSGISLFFHCVYLGLIVFFAKGSQSAKRY